MESTIDNSLLRESTAPEIANYFKGLHSRLKTRTVLDHLLNSVELESLPPRFVSIWIHGFSDAASLPSALHSEHSRGVRKAAILRLGKRLRSEKFMETWRALGATQGIVQLFSELPVHDVDLFCRCLGRTSTCNKAQVERREHMTELLKALASNHFKDSAVSNTDKRALLGCYVKIVPACTPDLVREWQNHIELLPEPNYFRLCQAHSGIMQLDCLQKASPCNKNFKIKEFESLHRSVPPTRATKQMSHSMQFSAQLLQRLTVGSNVVIGLHEILDELVYPLLHRLQKRRDTADIRAEVLQNVIHYLHTRPAALDSFSEANFPSTQFCYSLMG